MNLVLSLPSVGFVVVLGPGLGRRETPALTTSPVVPVVLTVFRLRKDLLWLGTVLYYHSTSQLEVE